ncbi:serine hydrolase domain-containing protein [Polaribacter sp. R77954]|uniref:serine hydrolase domain-containing protein n=1 Tax=Polaribacter sp. R77954 TaxID=3093870 RepID=UPI0037C8D9B1
MKINILFVVLFIATFLNAQESIFSKIDSIITAEVKPNHPGIAVGIIKDGKIIYEKYRGLANLQHQVKFDEKTRSNIASTAKQFTALMILDLSLNGKLSLEDDIRKYLTKIYPNVKDEIKIRHLLNHTSGIRDYVELLDLEGDVWWQRFGFDNDDILELLEKQEDLGFKPGSIYHYSNSNYNLLAKIIEKVTGKTFNEYSKTFFENLGMNETSFVERYMKVIPNRANPYSDWGRGEWWEVPTVTKTNGEGFLFTTLKDQLTYEKAVQSANYNNNILLIESQKAIPNSEIQTYGFGLELEDKLGRTAVHHSGGTYGFNSQTYRFPKEKITIFAMSNNGNISTNLIAQRIAKLLLPASTQKPKYDSKFQEAKNLKDEVTILGKYTYPNENSVVEILQKKGKTFWKEKNFTVEMVAEGINVFSFTNNPKLKVVFYEDKMTEYYPSGKTMHYKRINTLPVSLSDLEGLIGNYYNKELDINFDLKLSKENKLQFKLSTNKDFSDVEVYNKTYLQTDNFFMKIVKDQFERVTEILLTYGRAKNIRFKKKSNLKFQPEISTENGSIQVTTIGLKNGITTDILLTKNDTNGNEIWSKRLGGKSYDKASSILATDDGYLIIGSTSSFGKGNYDIYVIKTDKKGKQLWQNTYGDFYNEYGYSAEKTENGFLIKGTQQKCSSNTDVFNRTCTTNVWFVAIDENGKEISNTVLEEIKS